MLTSDRRYDMKVKDNLDLWMSDISFVVIYCSIVNYTAHCMCVATAGSVIRL